MLGLAVWHVSMVLCSILPSSFLDKGIELTRCLSKWGEKNILENSTQWLLFHDIFHIRIEVEYTPSFIKETIPWDLHISQLAFASGVHLQKNRSDWVSSSIYLIMQHRATTISPPSLSIMGQSPHTSINRVPLPPLINLMPMYFNQIYFARQQKTLVEISSLITLIQKLELPTSDHGKIAALSSTHAHT